MLVEPVEGGGDGLAVGGWDQGAEGPLELAGIDDEGPVALVPGLAQLPQGRVDQAERALREPADAGDLGRSAQLGEDQVQNCRPVTGSAAGRCQACPSAAPCSPRVARPLAMSGR
jgi:hypothetical protein